jgi:hypothetical protein
MQNINYHDINYKLKNLEKIPNSTHFNWSHKKINCGRRKTY